jgi:hypothetical protein
MQKNYCKCNTVHFASTGVHTICGEPSVIQDILLSLPHLLMNALLNKNYQICYHIRKLEIVYFMDMSYTNTFIQGWINRSIN